MINILDAKAGTLTILEGPTLSGKTRKMVELLKDAIQHQVPTLFFPLELTQEQLNNQVQLAENVFIRRNTYIEKIYDIARTLKSDKAIKLIMIDSITELYIKEKHCLGRSDILSLIVQQLKKLALELDVAIIITSSKGATNTRTSKKYIDYIKKT